MDANAAAKQRKDMEAFMKACGAEMGTTTDADADAILLKELGVQPGSQGLSEEEKILQQLLAEGSDEEMDDEDLLAQLNAEENDKIGQ
jgi:hypothetical protein